ncbi:DoxX-like family protein [Acinetobacter junii]|uniref:DoxX-like family protein n=1 Tax=Acinetobacter junii TaxID=40215 RepID=UPI00190084B7|nr:DoxX-like family protein [Acinetobacter junii]MBJ8441618.1 DoxX-like family protein [Acinetobacter junii]
MNKLIQTHQRILKFSQSMIALLWIYQGLFPKLIFKVEDEQYIWQYMGLASEYIFWIISLSGIAEIIFGFMFLLFTQRYLHWLNIISLIGLFFFVLLIYPNRIYQAFNPVVMNLGLISLSIIALWCIDALKQIKHE